VDVFIYYQAKDISAYAIINGSVLEPVDANFTQGTGDRNRPSGFTGDSGACHFFFGIAQATMTEGYYGYAQRSGRCAHVNTEAATIAAGDVLVVSNDATGKDGEAEVLKTELGTISAALAADNIPSIFGIALSTETAGTPDLTPTLLCPIMNLVGG